MLRWWWIWWVERKVSKEWRVLLCRLIIFFFSIFFCLVFGFLFALFFFLGRRGVVLFSLYVLTDNYLVIVIRFLIAAHFAAILGTIFDRSLYHFLLSIHCAAAMTRLLPRVIVFNQTGYWFVWQLSHTERERLKCKFWLQNCQLSIDLVCLSAHHLTYAMETFAVKLKCLLEEHLILDGPLVGEGRKVGQIHDGTFQIMFVPEQHAQCLFPIVTVFLFRHRNVFLHCECKMGQVKSRRKSFFSRRTYTSCPVSPWWATTQAKPARSSAPDGDPVQALVVDTPLDSHAQRGFSLFE